jgi:hypothetical protein
MSPENSGISVCIMESNYNQLLRMGDVYSVLYVKPCSRLSLLNCDKVICDTSDIMSAEYIWLAHHRVTSSDASN